MSTIAINEAKKAASVFQEAFNDPTATLVYHNVPDPNNQGKVIKEVKISVAKMQNYINMTFNIIRAGYPLLGKYIDDDGNGALGVLFTDEIKTMATDGNFIYISPIFLWKLAHTNDYGFGQDMSVNDFDDVDAATQFVVMHEIYHNFHFHQGRERKMAQEYPNLDHEKCNIVQDQEINSALESYCGFDNYVNNTGITPRLGGVLMRHDDENFPIKKDFEEMLYQPKFSCPVPGFEEITTSHRYYPTKFGSVWEEMYVHMDKNDLWPKAKPQDPFNKMQPSQGQSQDDMSGDQDIYDQGYYDGYRGNPRAKVSEKEYHQGYDDGVKWSTYDKQNGSCMNDPDYIAGKEYAEGLSESYHEISPFAFSSDEFVDAVRYSRIHGIYEAFKTINRNSEAWKKAIEDVKRARAAQAQASGKAQQGQQRQSSEDIQKRGQDAQNQTQGQQNGTQHRGNGSEQNGQGANGQNASKRGQESKDTRQSQGQDGNTQGQQNGKEGSQSSDSQSGQGNGNSGQAGQSGQSQGSKRGSDRASSNPGKYNRHQGVDKNGNPIKDQSNGSANGQGQQGQGQGSSGETDDNAPVVNIDRELKPEDFDFGKQRDQLTPEEGKMLQKNIGRIVPDLGNDPVEKWKKKITANGFEGAPEDNPMVTPPSVSDKFNAHGSGKGMNAKAVMDRIFKAMKNNVNWQDKLAGYIRGAFDLSSRKINKRAMAVNKKVVRRISRDWGGDSVGNIVFSVDQSGSMWGQDAVGGQKVFNKFFSEISKIREQIGQIKNIIVFPFTSGQDFFEAQVFPGGVVNPRYLKVDNQGGTDFNNIFQNMKKGRVVDEKTRQRLWDSSDSGDFPVVTVVMTDGEDAVPERKTTWDTDRNLIIWFVINSQPNAILQFKKRLKEAKYPSQYFIGIATEDI